MRIECFDKVNIVDVRCYCERKESEKLAEKRKTKCKYYGER